METKNFKKALNDYKIVLVERKREKVKLECEHNRFLFYFIQDF